MKRVLAIHDISCVGKCSLTVALPIISALGVECSSIPTALLSTHTGGFQGFTYLDLTTELPKILEHYKKLDLSVDAIYSGYLGSYEQIDIVKSYVNTFKNANYFLDPVMGDNGKLYKNFSPLYPKKMLELVRLADILIPNLTEASLLLGIEYKEDYSIEYLYKIIRSLSELGPRIIVLTGVRQEDKIGALIYDREIDKYYIKFTDLVPGYYHGTGDIFSSVICGAMTKGIKMDRALDLALEFTYKSILDTHKANKDVKYGVMFEPLLGMLTNEET